MCDKLFYKQYWCRLDLINPPSHKSLHFEWIVPENSFFKLFHKYIFRSLQICSYVQTTHLWPELLYFLTFHFSCSKYNHNHASKSYWMFYSQNHHKLFFITSAIRQSFNPIDSVELWKRAKLHIWINSAFNSKYIDDEKQSRYNSKCPKCQQKSINFSRNLDVSTILYFLLSCFKPFLPNLSSHIPWLFQRKDEN